MKTLFIICSLLVSSISFAQNSHSNGSAQLVKLVNGDNKFTVPVGKTWHITNVFCDEYPSDVEKNARIYFKSINDVVFFKGRPSLYHFDNNVTYFPIILKEGTSFELRVESVGVTSIMLYTEYDN